MSSAGPSSAVGKTCPYCRTTIDAGTPAVICPQCGIPHHEDCWRENGRCTTFGCQGGVGQAPTYTPQSDHRYLQNRPCPTCGFMMRPYETVCPYCRTPLLSPRPAPATPASYQYAQGLRPHRGGTVLTYGILSLVCCALFGIAAWVMGNEDLSAMNAGLMDDSGRATTEVGRILGIVAICINAAVLLISVLSSLSSY